jgi:hypothetical protein
MGVFIMSSILRFDEWQDSNGVPVLNGAGGGLALGKILQVVEATTTTTATTTSGTYADTNLTATITPSSATSKVLVLVSQHVGGNGVSQVTTSVNLRIMRDATAIWTSAPVMNLGTNPQLHQYNLRVSPMILDSPATTSAVTYKTQYASGSGTSAVNYYGPSHIILLEVAG